jgi:SAM-dependent methyltransferase
MSADPPDRPLIRVIIMVSPSHSQEEPMDANEPADADGCDAFLRAMWASVAPSWGENAAYVDTRGALVAQAMLDSAGLRRGERVLELACGPGGVGMAAAAIVGPDGEVVLSDFAPEMTAIAAERAKTAGLTNVSTCEVDLERIAFPDASFDAVLCREGLMLAADPARAVREAHRVLRPDGRAVFTVWGPRDRNPWLGLLFDAVTAQLGTPIPPPGVPGPFSLDEPGALGELLVGAGFADTDVREIPTPMHTSSVDEWWSVVPALAGPVAGLLGSLPGEVTAAIRACADASMANFAAPDGYELPGVSLLGAGRR